MNEFWESSFQSKHEMWGLKPADCAFTVLELFKKKGLNKILIPGFGYGRNAKLFADNGLEVTGIEISETAIALAKKHYGDHIKVHHGSVGSMPFDREVYDGVFCYALLHLLSENERSKLIKDCYNQLKPNGYMVFVALSTKDKRYGDGTKLSNNTFATTHGVTLYFYDRGAVQSEFDSYGLIDAVEISEPTNAPLGKPTQLFWQIVCRKI